MLAALVLVALQERSAYYSVPVEELELAPGQLLPQYDLPPWEHWDRRIESQNLPRAVIEGAGEVVVHQDDQRDFGAEGRPAHELGVLCVRTDAPRDVAGTLYLPKASGEGFLRIGFRSPAALAVARAAGIRNPIRRKPSPLALGR